MSVHVRGSVARWSAVGVLVVLLLALPSVIGALPASDADTSAPALREAVLDSDDVAFSGYAESAGGLVLPLSDRLTSVVDLLSDRTQMRAWYRSADDWRVDVVSATGETGVHHDADSTWTWQYEDAVATWSPAAPLALPTPPDLLPSELGRRLLSEAEDSEISRIGAQRVAGRDALGLRLVPDQPTASVSRVDLWIDGPTGLTLQLRVYGAGSDEPALDSRFLDLDVATPPASVTRFSPPAGARLESDDGLGRLFEAGRRDDRRQVPDSLAGLDSKQVEGVPGTVGVYGRGVTLLVAVPLPERFAGGLRGDLESAPGAVVDELGVRIAAGPLGVMVATGPRGGTYLLTGTVTLDALAAAAGQLATQGTRE